MLQQYCQSLRWLIQFILMLIHPNKNAKNVLDLPFFRRSEVFDSNINTTSSYSYKYTLLGVARNVLSGIEIYDTYFHRKYTKQYDKQRRSGEVKLELGHLSMFFIHFIHIFAIKSLIERQRNTTSRVNVFSSNLFGIRAQLNQQRQTVKPLSPEKQKEYKQLQLCLKPFINNIFQKLRDVKDSERDAIKQAQISLKERMKVIEKDLEDTDKMQKEYLPDTFGKRQLKRFILKQFTCIINLEVFQMHARKEVLTLFMNINRNIMLVKIPYINETTINPKDMLTANDIILPRYSSERTLIAYKLTNRPSFKNKEKEKKEEEKKKGKQPVKSNVQQFLHIRFERIRDVVSFLSKYHKSTNHFYPNLSASDVYLDQKSLQIFVSHHPLILDAVGLNKSPKPFQLGLATQATPQIDYELCHLQYIEQNLRMLKQKYYFPSQYRRVLDEDQDSVDKQNQAVDSLAKLQEQIHVWRLLNVIYYISHEKIFTKSLYSHYYWKDQERKPDTPFRFDTYKVLIKKIFEDIAQNVNYLIALLPPVRLHLKIDEIKASKQTILDSTVKKQIQPIISELSQNPSILLRNAYKNRGSDKKEFKFTLQDVRLKFDITENDDSLLESLKMQAIKSQLYIRLILVREISTLLIDKKCFKKLMNAKKYMLLFMIALFQELYLIILTRKNSSSKPAFRKQFQNQLQKEFQNIVLSNQFEKRKKSKQACQEKINEYQKRDDANKKFVNNNSYKEHSSAVKKSIEQIINQQLFQSDYLSQPRLAPQQIEALFDNPSSFFSEDEKNDLQLIRQEFLLLDCLKETLDLLKKSSQPAQRSIVDKIYEYFILDSSILNYKELGEILQPLFRDSEKEQIFVVISYLRAHQDNSQDRQFVKSQYLKQDKPSLIIELFRSMRGKKEDITKRYGDYLKKLMFLDEENKIQLIQNIQGFYRKISRQLKWNEFKQLWKNKIDRKIEKSYRTIYTGIEDWTKNQIQRYVKKPEVFHREEDFKDLEAGKDLRLYYNNKLVTLLNMYLSIDGSNWRHFQQVYNMMHIEDKTTNFKTSNTPIEKLSSEMIKIQNEKMLLIKDKIDRMPKDIALVFKNRQEQAKISHQSLDLIPEGVHQPISRERNASAGINSFSKQTFDE